MDTLRVDIQDLKEYTDKKLDEMLPLGTMKELLVKLRRESDMERKVNSLEARMKIVENSMVTIIQNQQTQTDLLRQLVQAQGLTPILDDNKKGEKMIEGKGESSHP